MYLKNTYVSCHKWIHSSFMAAGGLKREADSVKKIFRGRERVGAYLSMVLKEKYACDKIKMSIYHDL